MKKAVVKQSSLVMVLASGLAALSRKVMPAHVTLYVLKWSLRLTLKPFLLPPDVPESN